jgi:hypothetical protein
MSNLTSLETLAIRLLHHEHSSLDLFRQGNVHHYFPYLHSMSISGQLSNDWFEALKFDMPSLRSFSVELSGTNRYLTNPFDMKLPQISPRIVTFRDNDANYGRWREVWDNIESEKAVRQFLHHFSSAEQVLFRDFTDTIVRTALSDRINNGQQCPTSVYTEREGEFFRLHHTVTIYSS